jgi:dTDP-4-dehydrorhamnose 3,5-epimerase
MIFSKTGLAGAYTVDIDRRKDDRGHVARMFCADEFSAHGLRSMVAQASVSFSAKRGTFAAGTSNILLRPKRSMCAARRAGL